MCVAGVGRDGNILTSTDPTGGKGAWRKAKLEDGSLQAVSCPSVSMCVAGDDAGNILTSIDPTGGKRAWTKAPADHGGFPAPALGAVSCPSVSLCVAGDSNGDILTSTDPTGGASAWSNATVDVPGCCSRQHRAPPNSSSSTTITAPPWSTPPHRAVATRSGNVALNGDSLVLSWTHDGAQRQLQLR
jgi:hypothetical protein